MNRLSLAQIRFAARECELQQSGEYSVYNMCEAIEHADAHTRISLTLVEQLGMSVEPDRNYYGFRKVPVYFDNDPTNQAIPADKIKRALESLIEHGEELDAVEWYTEFEKIHPFNDGNGRVGAILYNMRLNQLHNPQLPPDVFGNKE